MCLGCARGGRRRPRCQDCEAVDALNLTPRQRSDQAVRSLVQQHQEATGQKPKRALLEEVLREAAS